MQHRAPENCEHTICDSQPNEVSLINASCTFASLTSLSHQRRTSETHQRIDACSTHGTAGGPQRGLHLGRGISTES